MGMLGSAVGLLITLIIVVVIYYNIAASSAQPAGTDTSHLSQMRNASINATNSVNSQAATFFTIAPIVSLVIVAALIIAYVQRIGG